MVGTTIPYTFVGMPAVRDNKAGSVIIPHAPWACELDILRAMYTFLSASRVSHPQGKDPESKRESLTHLYNEKALRYGIVFDELIRQVAVHSMALATLVGKVSKREQAYLSPYREHRLPDVDTVNLGHFALLERGDYSNFYPIHLA